MQNEIEFSYNWNNKLSSLTAFTTLRLRNDNRFREGEMYRITLKGRFLFYTIIRRVRNYRLGEINDFVSYLDTGYSADECRKILMRMYKGANWETQQISFILLVKVKNNEKSHEENMPHRQQAGHLCEASA